MSIHITLVDFILRKTNVIGIVIFWNKSRTMSDLYDEQLIRI